jgi:hypothetical protein
MSKYDFEKDYERGRAAEMYVSSKLGANLFPVVGRPVFGDMEFERLLVELKLDERAADTGNLFIEEYSNADTGRLGGPFACVEHDVDLFLYLIPEGRLIAFLPRDLVEFIDFHRDSFREIYVPNKGNLTVGFAIPIDDLIDLAIFDLDTNSPNFRNEVYNHLDKHFERID